METWRPIPGFEDRYDVSDQGNIRSWRTTHGRIPPTILKPTPVSGRRYLRVGLTDDQGRTKTIRVHRAVLLAFIGPAPAGQPEGRHLNDDQADNRLTNLAWGSLAENVADKIRNGKRGGQALTTHCRRGHERTESNTYRWTDPRGYVFRYCLDCRAERANG
jgi:hypothetical protein